jgi:hypothetical protein
MQLTADLIARLRELLLLSKKYPVLEPHFLGVLHQMQTTAQETLLDLSNGNDDEVYTYLLINAVYGIILPLIDGRLNVLLPGQKKNDYPTTEAVAFDEFLETMFSYLRKGF